MSEDIHQLYPNETGTIPPCDMTENATLSASLSAGDELAKKRLVEGNLRMALTHTKEYLNRGVTVNDLIQEANMALMLAVENYGALAIARTAETEMEGQEACLVEGALEQYLDLKIREALGAAIGTRAVESKVGEEILARISVTEDISQIMAEELGKEAIVEEPAERLKMTVKEVKDIMKLTLDAMTLNRGYEE